MNKKLLFGALAILLALAGWQYLAPAPAVPVQSSVAWKDGGAIDEYVTEIMQRDRIPGLAIVAIDEGKTVYKAGFGFSDVATNTPVSESTVFELASNTKALTALAVYRLVEEGRLDLSRTVRSYLPGFSMQYQGEDAPITLRQLLHQTSGIPFRSISLFEVADDDGALQRDVMKLSGGDVQHAPGSAFSYATINYDVLGAVIEAVTGQSFENYLDTAVLSALGLSNTSFGNPDVATGYRRGFGAVRAYDAPFYRGNSPAAYLTSDLSDIERWMKIHVGALETDALLDRVIERSRAPDRSVKPSADGSSYASGWWLVQEREGVYHHSGSNPNFATFFMFEPAQQRAIAVMANINSENVEGVARGVNDILSGGTGIEFDSDQSTTVDNISSVVVYFFVPFIVATALFLLYAVYETVTGTRRLRSAVSGVLARIATGIAFLGGAAVCIYSIPKVFFDRVSWDVMLTWGPSSIGFAIATVFASMVAFVTYTTYVLTFQKENDKQIFGLGALGAISGLGNTLCILTINLALQTPDPFGNNLYLIFLFGILLYVLGQKIVRMQVLRLTNQTVLDMRMKLVDGILASPYHSIEGIEKETITTVLNNDSELISQFPHILVTIITAATTLLFCFVYLGSVSMLGLALSLVVILAAVMMYFSAGAAANTYLENARTIQEAFFGFINDLTNGLKELNLNRFKRKDFEADMRDSGEQYCDKNIQAGTKFINVFVMGELLFTVVVGFVAFVFPILFTNLSMAEVLTFVLVFLYMTGPVNGVLNNIPQLARINVSWGRVKDLQAKVDTLDRKRLTSQLTFPSDNFSLGLDGVTYEYPAEDEGYGFKVGPINCQFSAGEITFITGGNGSGKSTLAKLITGLYRPDSGDVTLNGKPISPDELNELYTAIFWDYHLFKKLYGTGDKQNDAKIDAYLESLELTNIVSITDGNIDSTKLSTGQRKRLALLVSYLDDRPVYLFDEWAADQDPEYRRVFYREILPALKGQGKCIVVVSHDDQYFDVADKMIKMQMGQAHIDQMDSRPVAVSQA